MISRASILSRRRGEKTQRNETRERQRKQLPAATSRSARLPSLCPARFRGSAGRIRRKFARRRGRTSPNTERALSAGSRIRVSRETTPGKKPGTFSIEHCRERELRRYGRLAEAANEADVGSAKGAERRRRSDAGIISHRRRAVSEKLRKAKGEAPSNGGYIRWRVKCALNARDLIGSLKRRRTWKDRSFHEAWRKRFSSETLDARMFERRERENEEKSLVLIFARESFSEILTSYT